MFLITSLDSSTTRSGRIHTSLPLVCRAAAAPAIVDEDARDVSPLLLILIRIHCLCCRDTGTGTVSVNIIMKK